MNCLLKSVYTMPKQLFLICPKVIVSYLQNYYVKTCLLQPANKPQLKSKEIVKFCLRSEVTTSLQNEGKTKICWKCNAKFQAFLNFCNKCKAIQKPDKHLNYFELFQLPVSFEINDVELSKRFKSFQKVMHPDKFSMSSAEEISIAEEYSSHINKAYSVLRNPWSRGVYLLKTMGVEADQETTVDDPEILMTVMERNEAVAAAKSASELLTIDSENKKDMGMVLKTLTQTIAAGELESAKKVLFKLKYYTNIDEKINEKKLNFGIVR